MPRAQAGDLQPALVLVAPEPRERGVGLRRRRGSPRRRCARGPWRSGRTRRRTRVPSGSGKRARSPIAQIRSSEVRRRPSTSTPSSTARPASAASSDVRRDADAEDHEVGREHLARPRARRPRHGPRRPRRGRGPAPRGARRVPWASCTEVTCAEIVSDTTRAIVRPGPPARSPPRPRAARGRGHLEPDEPAADDDHATGAARRSRSARASSSERSSQTPSRSVPPTGSGRVRAPVASTSCSYASSSPDSSRTRAPDGSTSATPSPRRRVSAFLA